MIEGQQLATTLLAAKISCLPGVDTSFGGNQANYWDRILSSEKTQASPFNKAAICLLFNYKPQIKSPVHAIMPTKLSPVGHLISAGICCNLYNVAYGYAALASIREGFRLEWFILFCLMTGFHELVFQRCTILISYLRVHFGYVQYVLNLRFLKDVPLTPKGS